MQSRGIAPRGRVLGKGRRGKETRDVHAGRAGTGWADIAARPNWPPRTEDESQPRAPSVAARRMPDAFAYHDGFDLNTVEPLHVEVLVIHGGPVTLTASTQAAVESIHLTPDQARRLGGLLTRAAVAADWERGRRPDT